MKNFEGAIREYYLRLKKHTETIKKLSEDEKKQKNSTNFINANNT